MNAQLEKQLKAAKMAAREMMTLDTTDKNDALEAISDALLEHQQDILTANAIDLKNAKENGITDAMYDRLTLDEKRIAALSASVKSLISLDDPVGEVIREIDRPNGLKIVQVRVPMGVYGIIYEARPNVTVDIAALCLKSGNCCVLKGGKEAIMTIILMLLSLEGEQGLFSLSLKMRQYLLSRQGLVFVIFMSTRMLIYRWLLKLRKMPNCSVHPYVMR